MRQKYTIRSKEEKLAIVKRNLSGEAAKVLAREIGCNDYFIR
jgi:transposase-like protein